MHFLGLGGTSYYVKRGIDPAVLSLAGDQATRLTIGKSTIYDNANDSHFSHVWCYCALCRRLSHLRYQESEQDIESRSTYRHCLGCF